MITEEWVKSWSLKDIHLYSQLKNTQRSSVGQCQLQCQCVLFAPAACHPHVFGQIRLFVSVFSFKSEHYDIGMLWELYYIMKCFTKCGNKHEITLWESIFQLSSNACNEIEKNLCLCQYCSSSKTFQRQEEQVVI